MLVVAIGGCGQSSSGSVADQDEMTRYVEENPGIEPIGLDWDEQ